MDEVSELKYEYEKLLRLKQSLVANYERRKKLKLCDDAYETDINHEILKNDSEMKALLRQIRSIESEKIRKNVISGN